jgi:AraC-like DNA-binding protein
MSKNNNPVLQLIHCDAKPQIFTAPAKMIHLIIMGGKGVKSQMGPRISEFPPHSVYVFYDQQRQYQLPFFSETKVTIGIISISIVALHQFISKGTDELNFFETEIFSKQQYHQMAEASPTTKRCFDEIIKNQQNLLFVEAKKYAILADFFLGSKQKTQYNCPFLNRKENVDKIMEAKKFLITDLTKNPTLADIAKHCGINEYNLKTGFKEIYGKSCTQYLKDYKLSEARRLISEGQYTVGEVADILGYNNVSHFIDLFKAKFGITPKQFALNVKS